MITTIINVEIYDYLDIDILIFFLIKKYNKFIQFIIVM